MGKDLNINLNLDELGPIKKQYKKLTISVLQTYKD